MLKRYVEEPDSGRADELLRSDPALVTGRHTIVEVRRSLVRLVSEEHLGQLQQRFAADIRAFDLVELDPTTCESAAEVAEATGVRTLDALHLAAARRIGAEAIPLLTFDLRQAQAARSLGFQVLGA